MIRPFLLCLALGVLAAPPARADTTAVYRAADAGVTMTFEIAGADCRVTISGQPGYTLYRGGEAYVVRTTPKGVVVDRAADLAAVMVERGDSPAVSLGKELAEATPGPIVRRGTATIHGRTGLAYYARLESGDYMPRPFWVTSSDPELAEIGPAVARHFALGLGMAAAVSGAKPDFPRDLQALLATGTPLVFAIFIELDTVSRAPIPAARFALPAPPETRNQLRARLAAG
ncbi:MAG: hypothetical protein V4574_14700 [Pseudomonadota bacterium]